MDGEGDTARGSEVRISDVGIRASCTGPVWQNYHTAGCKYTLSRRVRCPCYEQEWCPNFTSFTNDSSGAAFNSSVIHHLIRPGTGIFDPRVAFGAPTVAGTAIRTSTLVRMAVEAGPHETAHAFDLQSSEVEAALSFEHTLQAAWFCRDLRL